MDLREIYNFFDELKRTRPLEFCLITTEPSLGFVDFHLTQALENCDLWIIQQDFNEDGIKLYLTDDSNKIIVAGDITRYPFLREEFRKALKRH